jgi:hypothetical protein
MDYYGDDFDEEIIDESIEAEAKKSKKNSPKKPQPTNNSSRQDTRSQMGVSNSIKEVAQKSRNGVRKTVNLTKANVTRRDDDNIDDYYMKPLKNIKSKSTNRKRTPDSNDDIEEDLQMGKPNFKSESPKPKKKFLSKDMSALDAEAYKISRSIDRKSIHSTPPKHNFSQILHVGYYDRFRDILESDIHGKSIKELDNENNKIRENMKDLNEQLTKIIERSKVSNFAPKKVEFKERHIDDKIRTTLKEIENNQKILELTATEYTSTKERLDQIKDPGYILDLEEKIQKAITDTETTRKTNKVLGLVNGNKGRDLDGIDKADGVAPMIQEANEKARELAVLQRKLKKLKDMNNKFDDENDTKSSKFEKVKDEYKKLQSEADRYNIKLEDNKFAVQYANLKNQVKNLEGVVILAANKNEKFLKSQVERAIEELIVSNMKQTENIDRLDTMIEEQKEVLKKMIEKEEQKNDKSIKDVISKIKASLDRPATIDEEPEEKNQTRSETNLISKPPTKKPKNHIYSDLPLYKANDKNVKVDSLLNKKDIAKREVNALRERVRNGEENIRSQTPKAEHDIKGFPAKPKDNTKPNLKSNKSHEEVEKTFQQAEQQKLLEIKSEEKKKPGESEVGLKPSFTKPNLFKKSNDSPPKENTFQSPEDKKTKQDDDIIVPPITKRDNPLGVYKKEEGLKLPGQELTLGGGKTDTPTTLKSPQGIFLTNQGASNTKREELLLPGSFEQKKKNDELIIDNKKGNLLEPTPIVNKPSNDDDDLGIGNIGGLSRLNRLKKGGNNPSIGNNAEKLTGLELPPQQSKLSNSNTASQPLTLNNELKLDNNNTQNQKVFSYDKNEGSTRPRNVQQQSDDLFGGLDGGFGMGAKKQSNFGHEEITLKEQPAARGGRDRAHLFENNNSTSPNKNEELSLFDNKKPIVVAENKNVKNGFDPDDIFGSNTKPLAQQDSKPNVGGTLGGTGIPGVRSGRAGVAGRPRQITGQEDDDLFGSSNTSNTKKEVLGFGGGNAGGGSNNMFGFGMGALNKEKEPTNNFGSNFGETETKVEPKRMRMNDLNKKTDSVKTKEKADQAQKGGGGFFDEFEL